jgi:hypothetical protein
MSGRTNNQLHHWTILVAILIAACYNSEIKSAEKKNLKEPIDFSKEKPSDSIVDIKKFIGSFPSIQMDTITVDSLFFNQDFAGQTLSLAESKVVRNTFTKSSIFKKEKWMIDDYILHNDTTLRDSLNNLLHDTGPLTASETAVKKLFSKTLADSTVVLFWSVEESQTDVCPYFRHRMIGMTTAYQNQITETICIAFDNSGGDPPAESEAKRYAIIQPNGAITIKEKIMIDENYEDNFANFSFNDFRLFVSHGKLTIKKSSLGKTIRMRQTKYE